MGLPLATFGLYLTGGCFAFRPAPNPQLLSSSFQYLPLELFTHP